MVYFLALFNGNSLEECNFCPVMAENKGFMPANKQSTRQLETIKRNVASTGSTHNSPFLPSKKKERKTLPTAPNHDQTSLG
jgi:hypothetical protein